MDSYRVEKKAAMKIALADTDAEIDPATTEGRGHRPEPELDRLSNILKAFNDNFGTLFDDTDRVVKRIREDIAPKVAADVAYQNAKENTPHTAKMAHDQALGKVMQRLLTDDTEIYKQFVENEAFKRFVGDMVYAMTNPRKSAGSSFTQAAGPPAGNGYANRPANGYCRRPLSGTHSQAGAPARSGWRQTDRGTSMEAERGFDFLEGQWDAVCRVPSEDGWVEAPGSLSVSRTLDGLVFVELFEGIYHGGALKGLGLRVFNRETREWEHTWTDTLEPGNFHVWKGVFQDGTIDSFAEWADAGGKPVRSRLTWSEITQDSAHWESARSTDGGTTWQLHWMIDWRRRAES